MIVKVDDFEFESDSPYRVLAQLCDLFEKDGINLGLDKVRIEIAKAKIGKSGCVKDRYVGCCDIEH